MYPRIHKMGGSDWRKAVTKAQKSIDDLADKLVELLCENGKLQKDLRSCRINRWQQEFEDAFPYEETEDQLQATREIKESMERPLRWIAC